MEIPVASALAKLFIGKVKAGALAIWQGVQLLIWVGVLDCFHVEFEVNEFLHFSEIMTRISSM